MKVARSTKAELKAQLENNSIDVRVLKNSAFLNEATYQADLSCLQKQLHELGHHEAQESNVQLQSQATQTPPSPLPDGKGERRQRRKECDKEPIIPKTTFPDQLKTNNQTNLLSEGHEFRADHEGPNLKEHHLRGCGLVGKKATHRHAPAHKKEIVRRLQERKDGFDNRNKKRVLGTVEWFNMKKGYDFIRCNDTREDIFVHRTAIIRDTPHKIEWSAGEGETVEFDVVAREKGIEAAHVSGPNENQCKLAPMPRTDAGCAVTGFAGNIRPVF